MFLGSKFNFLVSLMELLKTVKMVLFQCRGLILLTPLKLEWST